MPNTDQARGIGTNQINVFSKVIVQKKFGERPGRAPIANIYGNIGIGIMNSLLATYPDIKDAHEALVMAQQPWVSSQFARGAPSER